MPPIRPMVRISVSAGRCRNLGDGAVAAQLRREVPEGRDYLLIGRALERHHQLRQDVERRPAPLVELGRKGAATRGRDINLALLAGEGKGEPALTLATIAAVQGATQRLLGQAVVDPLGCLREQPHRADRGLLEELAVRRREWDLALVDAALRHLPG